MFRPGDAVIWLAERELTTELEELQLKGFDETPSAYRLPAPVAAPAC